MCVCVCVCVCACRCQRATYRRPLTSPLPPTPSRKKAGYYHDLTSDLMTSDLCTLTGEAVVKEDGGAGSSCAEVVAPPPKRQEEEEEGVVEQVMTATRSLLRAITQRDAPAYK